MTPAQGPFIRPPFISEQRWEGFEAAQKQYWHQVGTDFLWGLKQPEFRRLAMVLIDHPEWCASGAPTFDAQNSRAQDYAEGRRSVGVQLRKVLQFVSPDLFMRAFTEQMNFNRALAVTQSAEENKEH